MGRFKTLTILLSLGAWGGATDGAPPDDATATAGASSSRPAPTPANLLKAGTQLFNRRDYPLAAKYLKAADDVRDQLSDAERAVLDAYLKAMNNAPTDPAVVTASATAAPAPAPAPSQAAPANRRGTTDAKQKGRWLLNEARESISQGHYDEAEAKLVEVSKLDVRWGFFDDTPAKVAEALAKARPKVAATSVAHGNREQAKARLKEARAALNANHYDQAESIAVEVNSWGLKFGIWDDSPAKVADAARALRRRDMIRKAGAKNQPSLEVYDALVQEARTLINAGRLDEAQAKAEQARHMNVAASLKSDNAENVLSDIEDLRSGGGKAVASGEPAPVPVAEASPSMVDPAVRKVSGESDAASAPPLTLTQTEPADPQPSLIPDAQPAPAPVEAQPVPTNLQTAVNPGEQLLQEARDLYANGSLPAAREAATKAKNPEYKVEAQADALLEQITAAEQKGTMSLYESALDALRKGETDRASKLLTEVAAANGLDDSMRQRVEDLLMRLPKKAGEKDGASSLLDAQADAEALAAQQKNVEVGTKIAEHRRLMETDPDKAIALLETTLQAVKADQLNETAKKLLVRRLEVAIELAKKDKVAFDVKMQDKQARIEIEQKKLRILEAGNAKQAQLTELMKKAIAAEADGKYAEAEALAKKAMEIDPNDPAPAALAWKARVTGAYTRDVKNKEKKEAYAIGAFQDVDDAAGPDPEILSRSIAYPKDYRDLTKQRRRTMDRLAVKKDRATLEIERKLNDPVVLNVVKQPLEEVVNYLSSYTGLNVVVDPKALADEAVTSTQTVSLKVNNVKLKEALKLLLSPLNLTYKVEEGVLLITSPQSRRNDLITVPYDVADLVIGPESNKKPSNSPMNPQSEINPTGAVMDPMNPMAPVQGPGPGAGDGSSTEGPWKKERPNIDMNPIVQLITSSIAPGTWNIGGPGGTENAYGLGQGPAAGAGFGADALGDAPPTRIGTITPFYLNISLIIRHTPEVHEDVVDLLRQLRRLQDLQVSIEVRFITVNDDFFEQIGVSFDFAIQSGLGGKHDSFAIPNNLAISAANTAGTAATTAGTASTAGTAGTSIFNINPNRNHSLPKDPTTVGVAGPGIANFTPDLSIPFVQGSSTSIAPFNAIGAAASTFGIAFLSDLELYLFLTAIQGDVRSNLVQAPKVTTFNGSQASIINATVRNYVSALIPIVNAGAVAFQPVPAQINDGVQLFVTPVVSADRRYVRMTLAPNFITFDRFDTFPVVAGVGGGGLGGGGVALTGQIQLPVFDRTNISTTVTVPDGGTVLLGGVKRLREERREFGTPLLSKVPYINRLFRNIGIGRTTDSLMLMVTPRIIILEEEEERLGIPGVGNVTF